MKHLANLNSALLRIDPRHKQLAAIILTFVMLLLIAGAPGDFGDRAVLLALP